MTGVPSLSVVVVTYNEESHVEACLRSIYEECGDLLHEVILVDSDSTDRTVELAAQFPVKIARITDGDYTTPSAGRYVGTKLSEGEHLLFVDGDLELADGWIDDAIEALHSEDRIAGVSGYLNEAPNSARPAAVDRLRAVMLFDRDALLAVGGFDPFMRGSEDYELSYRFRRNGYRLLRIPRVVARHPDREYVTETIRRASRGYYYGNGQLLRRSWHSPWTVGHHLWYLRKHLLAAAWFLVGAVAVAASPPFGALWLVTSAASALYLGNKAGWGKIVTYPIVSLIDVAFLVVGSWESPPEADEFPFESVVETVEPELYESRGRDA